MARVASLGMYDFPGTAPALDQLWTEIAGVLAAAGYGPLPRALSRDRPLADIWQDPDLLLAQTCGYPLKTSLAGKVRLVATPLYAFPGCDGAWHRSFIVVGADAPHETLADLRGSRLAANGRDSNSGMNLLRASVAPFAGGAPFFASVTWTGSHAASLAAVAGGSADVAAIDCVSYALILREQPDLAGRVRVIASTRPSPSLPLVTRASASDAEVEQLRAALAIAAQAETLAPARETLGLRGFAALSPDVYDIVTEYERQAAALGYPELA